MRLFSRTFGSCCVLACSSALAACQGDITGAGPGSPISGAPGGAATPSGGAPAVPPAGTQVGEGTGLMPLRRLSRVEYANTITSLFGSGIQSTVELPDDPIGSSTYATPTVVGGVEVDRFEQAAAEISGKVAIDSLAGCPVGQSDPECAASFVKGFGKRCFRRPLLDSEVSDLTALYTTL